MPAFEEHHANGRAPDLVAAAASLLHHLEGPEAATSRASAILDINLLRISSVDCPGIGI